MSASAHCGTVASPPPPADLVWSAVESTVDRICAPGVQRERLRVGVAAGTARAFDPCHRGECAACDVWWADSGLPCPGRQVRKLAKHLVQALLPVLGRGQSLNTVWPLMADAAERAMNRRPPLRGPGVPV